MERMNYQTLFFSGHVDKNGHHTTVFFVKYRKIPKISPSKYKPLKIVTQKTLR